MSDQKDYWKKRKAKWDMLDRLKKPRYIKPVETKIGEIVGNKYLPINVRDEQIVNPTGENLCVDEQQTKVKREKMVRMNFGYTATYFV